MTGDPALIRIAEALERISPPAPPAPDFGAAEAFVWHVGPDRLEPVRAGVAGGDRRCWSGSTGSRDILLANTLQFAGGCPPTTRCFGARGGWGSRALSRRCMPRWCGRGMPLKIVELSREDLPSVRAAAGACCGSAPARVLLFCDDLSFSHDDQHYKALKAVLDGGIEGRPENVVFYATSNRRHLMPRDMIENERSTAISPSEAVEEKVSLSDRFGLWLGFHPCSAGRISGDDPGLLRRPMAWRSTRTGCGPRRSSGRRRGARGRGGWRGSFSPTLRGGWAGRCRPRRPLHA